MISHISLSQDIISFNQENPHKIGKEVEYFIDQTNSLQIEDFFTNEHLYNFHRSEHYNLNFGVSNNTVWIRFKIENLKNEPIALMPGRNFIDTLSLYSINGQEITIKQYGIGIKEAERDFEVHDYIFRLHKADVYYLKLRNLSGPLLIKPRIGSIIKLLEISYKNAKNFGIYFGLVVVLSIYSLIIFIYSKTPSSLFYLGFLIFTSLHLSMIMGTTSLFYPESLLLAISQNHFFTLLSLLIFGYIFLVEFLSLKKRLYWFYIIGLIWIGMSSFLFIASFFGFKAILFQLWLMAAVVFIFILITTFIYLSFKHGSATRIITIGHFFFGLGTLIFMLEELGVIVGNDFTENGFIIGNSIEMLCFAIAMAVQSNKHRKEKEKSQQLALLQSKEFSYNLIETQENERKRIAAELHDGIGQSLIILKNKILLHKQNKLNEDFSILAENVSDTISDVRTISYALRPHKLDTFGLSASIEDLVQETAAATQLDFKSSIEKIDNLLEASEEINLYRVVQELVNNIVKHAQCTEASIKIQKYKSASKIYVVVEDNGLGIQKSADKVGNKSGFGMKGITERIETMEGEWEIISDINKGTKIEIKIPINGKH